ncbi:MAG TPA: GNAT family N-acetyltransferase [Myxococcota bacterium]|nr:GNAT family N-acetyltransferase [Myxococcota bacterium]
MVAIVRNGRRIDLNGERERILGLVRNYAMATTRQVASRFPRLRKLVEIEILSSRPVRLAQRLLVSTLLGEISVHEEKDRPIILASIMSPAWPASEESITWIEQKLNRGKIRAFTARFSRRPGAGGSVVLIEDDFRSFGKTGYVGWLVVQLGLRGSGIGRRLLQAVEDEARRSGRELLIAEVMPNNVRSLGLFRSQGYREVIQTEIACWPRKLRERLLPGRVVLVKIEGDVGTLRTLKLKRKGIRS